MNIRFWTFIWVLCAVLFMCIGSDVISEPVCDKYSSEASYEDSYTVAAVDEVVIFQKQLKRSVSLIFLPSLVVFTFVLPVAGLSHAATHRQWERQESILYSIRAIIRYIKYQDNSSLAFSKHLCFLISWFSF